MHEEKDAENMTPYEEYSVDELNEALKKLFYLSDLNDADLAEMEHILSILREKDPLPPTRSVDELWDEFQSIYMKEPADIGICNDSDSEEVCEKEPTLETVPIVPSKSAVHPTRLKRHQKPIRIALIAAVLVAILVAVSATAAAMGYNMWSWLPIWSDENVRFVPEVPAKEPDEDDAHDIPSVLTSLGITEPLYPTWLPEDFERVETITLFDPVFLHESFKGNNRELTITISPITDFGTMVYQKENEQPNGYVVNSITHHLIENTNELSAVWNTENYTVLIAGNITQDEMKKIIDSVYEVKS